MLVDVAKPDGGVSTRWIADSGVLDLFLLLGPAPADVMTQYAQISGTTALPQVSQGHTSLTGSNSDDHFHCMLILYTHIDWFVSCQGGEHRTLNQRVGSVSTKLGLIYTARSGFKATSVCKLRGLRYSYNTGAAMAVYLSHASRAMIRFPSIVDNPSRGVHSYASSHTPVQCLHLIPVTRMTI